MIFTDIIDEISKAKSIILITHISPDGDALGSITGMYNALKSLDKDVTMFVDDNVPDIYNYLPGIDNISRPYYKEVDLILIMDCADIERMGKAKDLLKSNALSINIDHHISNKLYAKMNYVDTNAAATAEIIYQLIKFLRVRLDEDISTSLYTAIVTDTGGFMYESTTAKTHEIAGDLINNGARFKEVSDTIFHSLKYSKAKLIGKVLDKLTLYNDGKIAYMEVLKKDFYETGTDNSDIENIINFGRDIIGVEVAILLVERDNEFKISLRSKDNIDVNKIAGLFGGGGHIRAAGCSLFLTYEQAKQEILNAVIKELGEK
ncbi:MAG: DHH family phosphoesterase [Thermoanaerobacteraceae bacterium]